MKTKPIGVRFEQDMLDIFKDEGIADSPQKALNFLADFYKRERNKPIEKAFKNSKLFKPKDEPDEDQKKAKEEIERLQKEIANPPKGISVPMKLWYKVREDRIKELTLKIPPIPE